jgi:nucleoside-diphosphate-sugar epimerase
MKKLLVTGSSGLIGSEVCTYFSQRDFEVHGVDNNQRATFFGPQGDTRGTSGAWRTACLASRTTSSTYATARVFLPWSLRYGPT